MSVRTARCAPKSGSENLLEPRLSNNWTKLLALVVAVSMTADCAKFVSAGPSLPGESPTVSVDVGDRVRVSMRSGASTEFTVKSVNADGLTTDDGRNLPYSEISHIEKRTTDATKTTLFVVVLVGGALFLLTAAAMVFGDAG